MILRHLLPLLFLAFSASAVPVVLPENPTGVERAFAANLQAALETTNIPALVSLSYCEDDEPWAVSFFYHQFLQHPCDRVRFVRHDARDASNFERMAEANSVLPVQWFVVFSQPPLQYEAAGTNLTVLPAGLLNGRIVITRRMAAFTPRQKQMIMAAGGVAILAALWYAVQFLRLRSTLHYRHAPGGLAVLLVIFATECWLVTRGMSSVVLHPLRVLILPIFIGLLIVLAAIVYDEWSKSGETLSTRLKVAGPLIILFEGWKAWRDRKQPFVSPAVRSAVYVASMLFVVWFAVYVSRGVSIVIAPRHVQGTVVEGNRRGGIHYVYSVNEHRYTGSGNGNFERYYPIGSPVDVKYSGFHPAYSTIDDDPFLLIEQLACAFAIFTGIALIAKAKKRA